MKRAALTAFVFAFLVSLATLFTSADAFCDKVLPSITWEGLCAKFHGEDEERDGWYKFCHEVLQSAPNTANVSTYAIAATSHALGHYDGTKKTIEKRLGVGNLTVQENEALVACKVMYGPAGGHLDRIIQRISICDFNSIMAVELEYNDAEAIVNACAEVIYPYPGSVLDMVVQDSDLTDIAVRIYAQLDGVAV